MLVNCPKEGHQKVYKWREFLGSLYEWQYVKEKNIVHMKLEFLVGKLQGLTIKMGFYDSKKNLRDEHQYWLILSGVQINIHCNISCDYP